ncbi:hypothetical protein NDU88_001289 [Pleurodeles waltl]|uniref:Uncharacterized protein n=1 Tax=Pleurodeles waltl TaxID=8319 RepID=A0AAV7V9Y8_PLEWA|nr:hypothetical protein NDU88_001289 [Pleurodeles waltl]
MISHSSRKATQIGSVGPGGDQRSRIWVLRGGSVRREGSGHCAGQSVTLKPGARVERHRRKQWRGTAGHSRRQAGTGEARGGAKELPEDSSGHRPMVRLAPPHGAGTAAKTLSTRGPNKEAVAGSGDPDVGAAEAMWALQETRKRYIRCGEPLLGPPHHQVERTCWGAAVGAAGASEGSNGLWRR